MVGVMGVSEAADHLEALARQLRTGTLGLATTGRVALELSPSVMGLLEEPRYILKNVCRHFYEMPENTIREQTFCCGGGAGLNNEEFTETRLRGGLPRGNAVKYVRDRHGVNNLACICAIDRATLPPLCDYWAPGVGVSGVHGLLPTVPYAVSVTVRQAAS